MDWVDVAHRWIPRKVRYGLQRVVSAHSLKLRWRERRNPLAHVLEGDGEGGGHQIRFGIVRNAAQYHRHFIQACQEMKVPFRVLDLYRSDWFDQVKNSTCDVLLVWPDAVLSTWNSMIKERVRVLEQGLALPIFPSLDEIWMYEDKRRTAYWLRAHSVPHPRTWIFYDLADCEGFLASCPLPIVFKASFGASASGVRLFRNRGTLRRFVRSVFKRGFVPDGFDRRDRQWGSVLLQEYLPGVKEWRLVRIGDSFFGHVKGRVGDFHSGSGLVDWSVPEVRHLNFLEDVTESGGFFSMDVDVFETPDGRLLVNELQTVFGASHSVHQLKVDGKPGRFVRGKSPDEWVFEAGDFARNACANERIKFVINSGPGALLRGSR